MPKILETLDDKLIKRASKKNVIRSFHFKISPDMNEIHHLNYFTNYINSIFLKNFEEPENELVRKSNDKNSFIIINHQYKK